MDGRDGHDEGTEGIDEGVPNVARIYDYLLGGKDHYAADRAAAERLLEAAPETALTVRENRAFLRRAVTRLARAGIRQFVDIGAGLPTQANVHEVARRVAPDARVVYADIDPVVVAHGRALLASAPGVTVVEGDVREPERILADPAARELIDPAEPVAVLLLAVLHFVTDKEDPAGIVARLHAAMAPGSVLVISHVTSEGNRPEAAGTARSVYDRSTASIALRTREEIAALAGDFTWEEPGLVYAPEWRPDERREVDPAATFLFAGIARR
ncbi:SAM-dependent methyltransferase [Actinomadura viridis]|uniref:O-methyltransferase involved in polyketide biosynthesis n=1 Tax=Actinomadura viridis TaxID=58110 RepID=A0A931DLN8_9ACTN|nr:SAM-dependent methyltransferase [Actinomadura viridis]MBG6090838.1 O-methyltransferase involved in polyketide biosynthesis [Actinomadura viridis]